jgi:putative ABC transport system permease protein
MGTRILSGRPIMPTDRFESARVAVVSRGMAEALWPGQDALGRCIRVFADTMPCTTVVGVSEDIVQSNFQLGQSKLYHYYLVTDQVAGTAIRFLLVKIDGNTAVEAERVRKALQAVMPGDSYVMVRPMETLLESTYRSWRLGAAMFIAFAVLALAVAAIGLYGVIGYNVAQRMHELGVRVALGARRADILGLIVGQSVRLTLAGVTLGASIALVASRWLQPLLFQQSAMNPWVYGSVAAMMLVVALIASALPAVRAARADPNQALRAD